LKNLTAGKQGRRAYVQVLRLLESFDLADLHAAVKQALHLGAVSFDAVKHLVLCRAERRPPKLDLDIYPYLPRAIVETTSAKAYIDEIGGVDENFFLYYEEVDFCRRAARHGWECWHVPESRVVHLVGQSTGVTRRHKRIGRRPFYWLESRRRYYSKHHNRLYGRLADMAWITAGATAGPAQTRG
jgi:hypothetical protein